MTDTRSRLEHLHILAELDWGLVANLLGISLTGVRFARAGRPMNPVAARRLEALIKLVESAPHAEPAARQAWMREPIGDGRTRIQWFAALSRRNRVPLQGTGYTPAQLLGTQQDGGQP